MLKDFFNKTIKKNILSESEYNGEHTSMALVDWRNPDYVYYEFYTDEQLKYLFDNGLLQVYKKTGADWERPHNIYFEFTDKGKRLREWYNSSLKDYLYYNVFHLYMIRIWWQRFRIACGHHYTWQEYEDSLTNLDEI